MEGSLLAPRVHFAMVLERFVYMSVFLDNVSSKKHNIPNRRSLIAEMHLRCGERHLPSI